MGGGAVEKARRSQLARNPSLVGLSAVLLHMHITRFRVRQAAAPRPGLVSWANEGVVCLWIYKALCDVCHVR